MFMINNNLSPKLAYRLRDLFPGIEHVQDFDLEASDDLAIWRFAQTKGLHIITKDKDFNNLLLLNGFPPKVVRMDCGNATTKQIENLLRGEAIEIFSFLDNQSFGLMVIQ